MKIEAMTEPVPTPIRGDREAVDRTRATRRINLRRCDRCGLAHEQVNFLAFSLRDIGRWTHWAFCPTNGEPVLMHFDGQDGLVLI
jgi:hypothetical protein